MRIKAVIFDMDGVLVDTEPVQLTRNREYFKANGIVYDENELLKTVGAHSRLTWEIIRKFFPDGTTNQDYLNGLHAHFNHQHPNYSDLLNDHVIETLQWLKDRGYKIALASSGSQEKIKMVVEQCEIAEYFLYRVSGDMFERSKPDPEIYLTTAKNLGVKPEECMVVEDSDYGIKAAKSAGMYTVAIREERFLFSQDEADKIIDHMSDLVKLLD